MLDVLHRCKRPVARDAVVVGSTRFDFYREPFRGAMLTKREIATRIGTLEGRPLVSWATAFPHAKFWEKNREFHLQDCRQYKYDSEFGMTDDDQMANMRTEHEGRDASVQCLRACATAYPGADFVLKSHPLEDTAFYDNLIRAWRQEGLNNVYFIKGVYIWDILNAATVHIHHNCTTGTEAWLMDKPSVELQFIHLNWERFDMRSSYMGAGAEAREAEDHADSPDAAVAKVGAYLRGEHVSEALLSLRRAYVDKWFYKVDGYATARAVSTLVGTVESRPIRGVSMWSRECFGARLRLRAKEAVGSPFDESLRHPGRPITSEFDAIGHWDRTICQRDVLEWEKKLRKVM